MLNPLRIVNRNAGVGLGAAAAAAGRRGFMRSAALRELDEQTYGRLADETLDQLADQMDAVIEKAGPSAADFEVENAQGVLTVSLGPHGTYVLNRQPPNRQIWLSSPLSGPQRYDWDGDARVWFYHRNDALLVDLLNHELGDIFHQGVDFKVDLD